MPLPYTVEPLDACIHRDLEIWRPVDPATEHGVVLSPRSRSLEAADAPRCAAPCVVDGRLCQGLKLLTVGARCTHNRSISADKCSVETPAFLHRRRSIAKLHILSAHRGRQGTNLQLAQALLARYTLVDEGVQAISSGSTSSWRLHCIEGFLPLAILPAPNLLRSNFRLLRFSSSF